MATRELHPLVEAFGRPTWLEVRAIAEARTLAATAVPLDAGGRRPVVLVPGFLGSESSLDSLATWLREGDYDVRIADLEMNIRGSGWGVDRIIDALDDIDAPSVLIGHSRGGQQARIATQRRPELVQQLITLGSPLSAPVPRHFLLRGAVESLRLASRLGVYRPGDMAEEEEYAADLDRAFDVDVPWTSISSSSDGFVAPEACFDPAATMVSIDCTHLGLIQSVAAFTAVAGVLRAPTCND
ncbi:MAG: hypothetical protein AAF567_08640 [Actinomycetota bacterium]